MQRTRTTRRGSSATTTGLFSPRLPLSFSNIYIYIYLGQNQEGGTGINQSPRALLRPSIKERTLSCKSYTAHPGPQLSLLRRRLKQVWEWVLY